MSRSLDRFFRSHCPFPGCPSSCVPSSSGPKIKPLVRHQRYYRVDDHRWIQRRRCQYCKRTSSSASFQPEYRQKKRSLNKTILELFASGLTQRRMARLLGISRVTVARKLLFLAAQADHHHQRWLASLMNSGKKITEVELDEMESFEHTRCLPLSLPLIVLPDTRKILGFAVARMPAKGPLAEISRQKYGLRVDERAQKAAALLSSLKDLIDPQARVTTDQNPHYRRWLREQWPQAQHLRVKGRKPLKDRGQGELKQGGYDPLFALNHTAAMLRANVSRLVRRTWCTTKRVDRLEAHLKLYVYYHNTVLTA